MERRGFLRAIAALPFMGWLGATAPAPAPANLVTITEQVVPLNNGWNQCWISGVTYPVNTPLSAETISEILKEERVKFVDCQAIEGLWRVHIEYHPPKEEAK